MPTFPKNVYWASSLIGGGQGALDAIDGADLIDIDAAFVIKLGYALFYSLDADSGAAESSPDVIAPDVNPGDKRWILTGISEIPAGAMKQLKNIGATTISAGQWSYLGAMNQGVAITNRITANIFKSASFSIADDTAWSHNPLDDRHFFFVGTNFNDYCIGWCGYTTSTLLHNVGFTSLDGVLNGTTGADGNLSIGVNNGTLYIENRKGATRVGAVTILAAYTLV